MLPKSCVYRQLDAPRSIRRRIHVRAERGGRGNVPRYANQRQCTLTDKLDEIGVTVVEERQPRSRALLPQALFEARVETPAPFRSDRRHAERRDQSGSL